MLRVYDEAPELWVIIRCMRTERCDKDAMMHGQRVEVLKVLVFLLI